MDLCETRRLGDVTVVDLVAEAGMARQTFYNHSEGTTAMLMDFFASDMSTPNEVYMKAIVQSRPAFMRDIEVPPGLPDDYPR